MRRVACSKCGTCGVWKPKREMQVCMITQLISTPERGLVRDNPIQHYECRSHTKEQIRKSRDRWLVEMAEAYR